jgi:hypothetical protein
MDEDFRNYFRWRIELLESALLVRERERVGGELQVPAFAVGAGLEAARREARLRDLDLREDAQLLIAIMAQELLAQPVAAVTPEDAEMLPAVLEEDVSTIVRQAGESANDREVSAHSVIDGLSSSWDRLRSSNLRVWDRRGGGH